jgi:hypothetical protein
MGAADFLRSQIFSDAKKQILFQRKMYRPFFSVENDEVFNRNLMLLPVPDSPAAIATTVVVSPA